MSEWCLVGCKIGMFRHSFSRGEVLPFFFDGYPGFWQVSLDFFCWWDDNPKVFWDNRTIYFLFPGVLQGAVFLWVFFPVYFLNTNIQYPCLYVSIFIRIICSYFVKYGFFVVFSIFILFFCIFFNFRLFLTIIFCSVMNGAFFMWRLNALLSSQKSVCCGCFFLRMLG